MCHKIPPYVALKGQVQDHSCSEPLHARSSVWAYVTIEH